MTSKATNSADQATSNDASSAVVESDSSSSNMFRSSSGAALNDQTLNIPASADKPDIQVRGTVDQYAEEDPSHPNWRTHHKHVFILSAAGKPIYSRYGDEQKMASFMAAVSGLVSFVDDMDDQLQSFEAGQHRFVFLVRGPLYLVAVADTGESAAQLRLQLTYVHAQILFILTAGVEKIFRNKAAFDLRNLLGGAGTFINALLRRMEHDASFYVDAVHCLRLRASTRQVVGQAIHGAAHSDLLFGMMIANNRLVHLIRPKRFVLAPLDLHLLMNFVSSATSFRSNETWSPVCLCKFNDTGFLHAHISYISRDVCLVLISTSADAFFTLSACKSKIVAQLNAHSALSIVQRAAETPDYTIAEIGVPGLLHFIYKAATSAQFTSPSVGAPYVERHERKRLFRLYQHAIHRMGANRGHNEPPNHKIFYYTTEAETIVGWVGVDFELYAVFSPLENKSHALKACNELLRWIRKNETSLFILSAKVWS